MASAIQLGLVPGFAEQDGDQIARLLSGTGGPIAPGAAWGLGNTVSPAISATGNNNIGAAYDIVSSINTVTVATGTNNSVQLPLINTGSAIRIYNTTASVVYVFPATLTSNIDAAANGVAVQLAPGARCDYMFMGNNHWVSNLLGSPSA
jgi:hypothetical protein